ncbi:MAG: aminopeptidase P family protein [Actinobacteria bacterium]|nr:aminopeptidase P family protein [Actinomycetota bacterium]
MSSSVDYSARRAQVVRALGETTDARALLVSDAANVRWLTGLSSSNAAVVISDEITILATDSRYAELAKVVPEVQLVLARDVHREALLAALAVDWDAAGETTFAFESNHLSSAETQRLSAAPGLAGYRLVATSGLIAKLRMFKEPTEIELIRRACEISTDALGALIGQIRVGMSEIVIARTLEYEFAIHGADDRAFPTIAASGPNSATPHHQPTSRPIGRGEILKLDFGALLGGYHADCTRTFVVGAPASERQTEIHELVERAAAAGRRALGPGVDIAGVDTAARSVIADQGLGEYFSHGLGHGIGLEIHEPPLLSGATAGTLAQGNVVTIEPGIYLPEEFGVRIEDTCVVTDGGAQVLTDFPRELIVIDG